LPFDDDFETSAFFSNANNIKAQMTVIGTKCSFALVASTGVNCRDLVIGFLIQKRRLNLISHSLPLIYTN
jgi:hypothetical protein